jgi:hypothetical protein
MVFFVKSFFTVPQIQVDITINERIVMPVQELPVLKGYDEYADLPHFDGVYRAVRRSLRVAGLMRG